MGIVLPAALVRAEDLEGLYVVRRLKTPSLKSFFARALSGCSALGLVAARVNPSCLIHFSKLLCRIWGIAFVGMPLQSLSGSGQLLAVEKVLQEAAFKWKARRIWISVALPRVMSGHFLPRLQSKRATSNSLYGGGHGRLRESFFRDAAAKELSCMELSYQESCDLSSQAPIWILARSMSCCLCWVSFCIS